MDSIKERVKSYFIGAAQPPSRPTTAPSLTTAGAGRSSVEDPSTNDALVADSHLFDTVMSNVAAPNQQAPRPNSSRQAQTRPQRFLSRPGAATSSPNNTNGRSTSMERRPSARGSRHQAHVREAEDFEEEELQDEVQPSPEQNDWMFLQKDAALQSPEFRFPTAEPLKLRMMPYNSYFPLVEKDIPPNGQLVIGRYQRNQQLGDGADSGVFYRSTVVSRKHALLSFKDGEVMLKDAKSLGGTFVNAVRLSDPSHESEWTRIKHGDILQFGVDYRPDARTGQVRNKDRCVEVRIEFPKHFRKPQGPRPPRWNPSAHHHTECCICISSFYEKQALFIAPCSHTFHYRCIAPLLRNKGFTCPMCRYQSHLQETLYENETDDDDAALHQRDGALQILASASTDGLEQEGSGESLERAQPNASTLDFGQDNSPIVVSPSQNMIEGSTTVTVEKQSLFEPVTAEMSATASDTIRTSPSRTLRNRSLTRSRHDPSQAPPILQRPNSVHQAAASPSSQNQTPVDFLDAAPMDLNTVAVRHAKPPSYSELPTKSSLQPTDSVDVITTSAAHLYVQDAQPLNYDYEP